MSRSRSRLFAMRAAALVAVLCSLRLAAADTLPSVDADDLAQGPYASMHMLLQKTILRINVASIDVRVDRSAQGRLRELARGRAYSDALAQQLAQVAMEASRAVVQMQFKHDVSLNRWIGVVRDNLAQARTSGFITRELEQRVSQGLPGWFAALDHRGYEKNDRLIYSISGSALHTVVVAAGGKVFIDRIDNEPGATRVVLATTFGVGSDFREPLLRSLFEPGR